MEPVSELTLVLCAKPEDVVVAQPLGSDVIPTADRYDFVCIKGLQNITMFDCRINEQIEYLIGLRFHSAGANGQDQVQKENSRAN